MKNKIIYLGLVLLSALYMLEVDFASLTSINYLAFAIIALALGSMILNIYFIVRDQNKKRKDRELVKEAKKIKKDMKKGENPKA